MERRPLRPFSRSKMGSRRRAALAEISSTMRQERSSSVRLGSARGELEDARLPDGEFLLEYGDGDGRVAGGADCAVRDGVGEIFDGGRVVPQAGGGGLGHFVERAFEVGHRSGGSPASSARCKRVQKNPNTGESLRSRNEKGEHENGNFFIIDRIGRFGEIIKVHTCARMCTVWPALSIYIR